MKPLHPVQITLQEIIRGKACKLVDTDAQHATSLGECMNLFRPQLEWHAKEALASEPACFLFLFSILYLIVDSQHL
jgi:hypothetical protein